MPSGRSKPSYARGGATSCVACAKRARRRRARALARTVAAVAAEARQGLLAFIILALFQEEKVAPSARWRHDASHYRRAAWLLTHPRKRIFADCGGGLAAHRHQAVPLSSPSGDGSALSLV